MGNNCGSRFAFLHTESVSEKGSTLIGKNPKGSKSFSCSADPFFRKTKTNFDRVISPESVAIPLKYVNNSNTIVDA